MTTHGSFRAQLRLPFNPEKQLLEPSRQAM